MVFTEKKMRLFNFLALIGTLINKIKSSNLSVDSLGLKSEVNLDTRIVSERRYKSEFIAAESIQKLQQKIH